MDKISKEDVLKNYTSNDWLTDDRAKEAMDEWAEIISKERAIGIIELINVYDEYISLLSNNPAESMAYVHGFRHSEENIEKGKRLRERISLLKVNLETLKQKP